MSGTRIRHSGFTLLELLVSLAIAAAVMVGVQAAVSVAVDVAARGSDRADTSLRVETVRTAIVRWLESAHLDEAVEAAGFTGKDASSVDQPRDELTFVTLDPGLLGDIHGGPVRIRLRVAAADSGLVADYRRLDESLLLAGGALGQGPELAWRAGGSIVLLPEVRGLEVRYLVALGEELRWFAGWSSRVRLPRAVELRFYRDPQAGRSGELVEVPLRVALPEKG